ncbi:class I tRNA ligase family protein, partial [Parvibaculum sp.]|uniref:class I tRNA ligase family protein n=1 Tax=Parvibaculum sp. TaxID=2024848 RepID=UPI0032986C37
PIITDEYPDKNFGSGAVKITGAHDFNDYGVAKRNGIPLYALMDTQGQMRADGLPYVEAAARAQAIADGSEPAPEDATGINLVPDAYRGLDRFEARKRVVEDVTAEGLAVMTEAPDPRLGRAAKKAPVEPGEGGEMRTEEENLVPLVEAKKIMQPFGDRSKVVIEPMLTDQWFVATDKIVQPAIDAVRSGEVTILPEQDRKVYFHWLENIEPWCISRQLWWGHQIPVWFDDEGNEYCAPTEAEAQAMAPGKTLRRDPDVLDTWFSSGLWPIGTLGWPEQTAELEKYFPTSVLVTGFDIIFFWVARMMMMQYAVVDQKPFDTVYVHALVRDEKGKKMS